MAVNPYYSGYFLQNERGYEYIADHDRIVLKNSPNELEFAKGDEIETKRVRTWKNLQPAYLGAKHSKEKKKHFLHSAMSRKYLPSDNYPSFLNMSF
jgi:hypothetical protein